jgi:hypothetical protein
MFPQTEKGISATPDRDDPGTQKSLDLAAFPASRYVFLVSKTTVSTWLETTIRLTHFSDRSRKLVHDFNRPLIGAREHLPVHGNKSRN